MQVIVLACGTLKAHKGISSNHKASYISVTTLSEKDLPELTSGGAI